MIEFIRLFENGFDIGPFHAPRIFGLTEIGLSGINLGVLYLRPGRFRRVNGLSRGYLSSPDQGRC